MPDPARATSISDLVRRSAGQRPDGIALVEGSTRLSWTQLQQRVDRLASALAARGIEPGDRIVLQAPTSAEFVIVYLAVLQAGAVVVPVNPSYTEREVTHIVGDAGARLLVTSSVSVIQAADRLRAASPQLAQVMVTGRSSIDGMPGVSELIEAGGGPPSIDRSRTGEDLAVLLYTSGTSGRPKGAMLPVRALLANLEQFASIEPQPVSSDDVVYLPLPLFHIFGLNAGLGMALHAGARIVLRDRFDAEQSLMEMAAEQATVVIGAPLEFTLWAQHKKFAAGFANVRLALSGSAPLQPSLVGEYAEIDVALYEGYGLTEAAPVITVNLVPADGDADAEAPAGYAAPKPGSIGRPLPGVEVRLLDTDGEVVEPGDLGMLSVRGPNLFLGYWPDAASGPDPDGWFATGDLAVADDDGDYYLVGRRSDLILVNGFNVYPAEVEAVLTGLEDVAEAAVIGEPTADGDEQVVAYVVAKPGHTVDPDELLAEAATSLARFKLPAKVVEATALPHTATGKVMKWRLRGAESATEPAAGPVTQPGDERA